MLLSSHCGTAAACTMMLEAQARAAPRGFIGETSVASHACEDPTARANTRSPCHCLPAANRSESMEVEYQSSSKALSIDRIFCIDQERARVHRPHRMLYQRRVALTDESPREPLNQTDHPGGLAQLQRPGVRADRAAIKRCHHATAFCA